MPHVIDASCCPERHCNKCDKYRKELEAYRRIGTLDEFKEAKEKQTPKRPGIGNDNGRERKCCPVCGCFYHPTANYCSKCGQALKREG